MKKAEVSSLAEVRQRLSTRREELRKRLDRVRADQAREAENLSMDSADRAIQRENDDVIDSLGNAAATELAAIDTAVTRLDVGRYGLCEKCLHPIEAQRLAALPYATSCVRCSSSSDTSSA